PSTARVCRRKTPERRRRRARALLDNDTIMPPIRWPPSLRVGDSHSLLSALPCCNAARRSLRSLERIADCRQVLLVTVKACLIELPTHIEHALLVLASAALTHSSPLSTSARAKVIH